MKISQKFNRLTKMPFRVIVSKAIYKAFDYIYHRFRKRRIMRKPIDINDQYFLNFKTHSRFLFDLNRQKYISKLRELKLIEKILTEANNICDHRFNFLGITNECLGEKLKWNIDFKTGFIWENQYYKDIKIIDVFNNADVKIPWELSRFQHIFTLGKAYLIERNEKYAFEFMNEIEDWIENNPVEMSVNWTCTMDVSIRAVNWIAGYYFFMNSKIIHEKFRIKFNKILYLHGRYIYKNLENKGSHTGNHYLSNIAGLIWLGLYFNNHEKWLSFGLIELEKEMFKTVNTDGTNYEASTAYHRLVAEIFLLTTILCKKNSITFSKSYLQRLEKMCEFIMDICKPNGNSPLIGDMDDGRFVIITDYLSWNRKDFRYILAIAGEFFDRDDYRFFGKEYMENALWCIDNIKERIDYTSASKSKAYKQGGYYILKNDSFYCVIRCGELSMRGEGGHSHNDQLSFELNVLGQDFIIDPGIYVYTADYKMRNLYRSTSVHNTLYIEGLEQNEFNDLELFRMKEQTFGECLYFSKDKFVGHHYGYKEKCGFIHKRKYELYNTQLKITDSMIETPFLKNKRYSNEIKVSLNFTLSKDVEVISIENGYILIKNGVELILDIGEAGIKNIDKAYISDGYGQIIQSQCIKVRDIPFGEFKVVIVHRKD